MKKLRIFLDADEVLMKFLDNIIPKYNEFYGMNATTEQFVQWDMGQCVPPEHDIYQFMDAPQFFSELEPFPDAVKVLKQLIDDGHDVFISTAAWEEAIPDKYESFKKHFPFLDFGQILMVKRKDVLQGDIMLDDGPHNIESSICHYPVIMDRPYNQHLEGLRVTNLTDFYELVCKIAIEEEKKEGVVWQ